MRVISRAPINPLVVVIQGRARPGRGRKNYRPIKSIVINLDGTGASTIPFGAVPAGPTIDKIVITHNKSSSQFGVNRTIGWIESLSSHRVILDKEELLCAEPGIICPATVAEQLATVGCRVEEKTLAVSLGLDEIVIGHAIEPAVGLN